MLLAALLFGIGIYGVLTKKNAVVVLMCIELMLNAVNLNFIAIAHYTAANVAQLFAILVIIVAAAEVAVGLALIVAIYKQRKSVDLNDFNLMKW